MEAIPVGKGKTTPFRPTNSNIKSNKYYLSIKLIKEDSNVITQYDMRKVKQEKIFDFFFCTEHGCYGMFNSQLQFE